MHPTEIIRNQKELDEYLLKTVSTNDIASGGALNREQANDYIDLGIEQQVALKRTDLVNQIRTDRMTGEVPMFDICSPITRAAGEHTSLTATNCAMDARKPTFGKYLYDLIDLQSDYAITYQSLRGNVAKEGLRTRVNEAMNRQSFEDVAYLFWQGNVATYAAGLDAVSLLLKTNDGIIKQALDCTTTLCDTTINNVLTASVAVTYNHFAALLRALPQKYRNKDTIKNLVWWGSPTLAQEYRIYQATTGTNLSDERKDRDETISPLGIPFVEDPWMPVDLTAANANYLILTTKQNLWWAMHVDEFMRYMRFDQHCRAWFYTTFHTFDCGIVDCEKIAIMQGIPLRATGSFTY